MEMDMATALAPDLNECKSLSCACAMRNQQSRHWTLRVHEIGHSLLVGLQVDLPVLGGRSHQKLFFAHRFNEASIHIAFGHLLRVVDDNHYKREIVWVSGWG